MQLLPEWAPNLHSILVHFPVALLSAAIALDLVGLGLRSKEWPRSSAAVLYVFGTLMAIPTYLAGEAAADSVSVPARAQPVLTDHADWALWTVIFFLGLSILRLAADWKDATRHFFVHGSFVVLGLLGGYLLYQTGDQGGRLVFEHGVGVQAAQVVDANTDSPASAASDNEDSETAPSNAGPVISADGSWEWTPGEHARSVLSRDFEFVAGRSEDVQVERDATLLLRAAEKPVLFAVDQSIESLQATARINLDRLQGRFQIAHHVEDDRNYDFLEIENNTMRLGRVRGGERNLFDEADFQSAGRQEVRVVADRDHFRGYIGEELITHGHANPEDAGVVGLHLPAGTTVPLEQFNVQSLR